MLRGFFGAALDTATSLLREHVYLFFFFTDKGIL